MNFALLKARFNFESPRMTKPSREGALSALWDKCFPPANEHEKAQNPYKPNSQNHYDWKQGFEAGIEFLQNQNKGLV